MKNIEHKDDFTKIHIVDYLKNLGRSIKNIAETLRFSEEQVEQIIQNNEKTLFCSANVSASLSMRVITDTPVPYYTTTPAAGKGSEVKESDNYNSQYVVFPNAFLRSLNITPANAHLFNIQGKSMQPKYIDRELIIVDFGVTEYKNSDECWLIRVDNEVMVKQIKIIAHNHVQAVSINPEFMPFSLEGNWEVKGKIVWGAGMDV